MASSRAERLREWFAADAMFLYCWFRARLGPALRRDLEVEDLVQEVWVRAMLNERSDDAANPRMWLLAIARNVVLEVLRASGRRPQALAVAADGSPIELADEVTSLTRALARDELRQRFFAELDALDEDSRQLVVQHGLEGRPLAQIAARLGISPGAAHKRWQRLRDHLYTLGSPADLL